MNACVGEGFLIFARLFSANETLILRSGGLVRLFLYFCLAYCAKLVDSFLCVSIANA
jgi:hypothetical protein